MRKLFADQLLTASSKRDDIWLLTADLGFGVWDNYRDSVFTNFKNVGASESTMLDIAVGLAYEGKLPFCYSITPFLIYRPFEVIRTYINHERLPVKLVGAGRDKDYAHDGISHWAEDVEDILKPLKNIHQLYPNTPDELKEAADHMLKCKNPDFISLRRN